MAITRGKASSAIDPVLAVAPGSSAARTFVRIPPFPGARIRSFSAVQSSPMSAVEAEDLRRLRVGGTFWASQPELPTQCVLVRASGALEQARDIADGNPVVLWADTLPKGASGCPHIRGDCDPWHMLSHASGVVVMADDEVRLVAALLAVPVFLADHGLLVKDTANVADLIARFLPYAVRDPFTGQAMSIHEAIELCGFWRRLIDSNRQIAGGLGFAFWKQEHVAPLLWNGSGDFRFLRSTEIIEPGASVAIWRAKVPHHLVNDLERSGTPLVEVEDGFLRSRGLGADCIPPLSITVDRLGPHFDPSQLTELEALLQDGSFDDDMLGRARELRRLIVEAGIGKYEQGGAVLDRPAGDRVHILVPGQVEDDRAVKTGGCGLTSNLELLGRVRAQAPDAYILYKPHPDVVAGHRCGEIADEAALQFADEIVGEISINSLIAMVDEVHVNTSLAGFEALLRGKRVTTHGVPFYAGWGLTTDLGPVPRRRSATRSLDELVAATLLIYPRYLDPVSGLPCPAEVVVMRLAAGEVSDSGLLVGVRRLQGKVMRRVRSLVQ